MKKKIQGKIIVFFVGIFIISAVFATPMAFARTKEELAKELANPLATMSYIPFQFNYDTKIGPDDKGSRYSMIVQPLIPFPISDDWNIISRTIIPTAIQNDIFPGAGEQSGLGDILQSAFFSPKLPTENGWIWGVGPALLFPTASHDLLGSDKWGVGPTAIVLKQEGPWTYGALANHIWSVAGDDDKEDINATFLQPFLAYTTKNAVTLELSTESTYDWKSKRWTIPLIATLTKVIKLGDQYVSIGGGIRYWLEGTESDPEGLGLNVSVTLMF